MTYITNMPAFTKGQSKDVLKYVMDNILDFDTDHAALALTQNSITTMWDLLGMSFDDIATLTYKDAAGIFRGA